MIFDDKNCCSARAEFKKREMYTRYMRSAYLILNDLRVFWIKITKTFYKKQNKSVDELAVNEWMYQKLVSHLDVFIHDSCCARRRMWSNNNKKKTIVNREFPIAARHSDLVLLFSSFFFIPMPWFLIYLHLHMQTSSALLIYHHNHQKDPKALIYSFTQGGEYRYKQKIPKQNKNLFKRSQFFQVSWHAAV